MKKILILLFSLFLLSSPSVFAETYVCSHELDRFGRSGEIETLTYKRIGNSFSSGNGFRYEIFFESTSNLILTSLLEYIPSLMVVFFDKDTKEWGQKYLKMEEYRKHPPSSFTYGKCTVVQ